MSEEERIWVGAIEAGDPVAVWISRSWDASDLAYAAMEVYSAKLLAAKGGAR